MALKANQIPLGTPANSDLITFHPADGVSPSKAITKGDLATLLGGSGGTHASTHQNGGDDEINVDGLSGLLADGQTPLAHATSHRAGGADKIKLDDLEPPDDNTDLNASTSTHGLLKKLSGTNTEFLDGSGAFDTVKDTDLSTSDVVTNDVSTSKHGFAPKAPNDATKFLDGTGAWDTVKDADLVLSDVATNNAAAGQHGFLKKLSGTATEFMNGAGNWATPAGTPGSSINLSGTYASLPAAGTAGRTYMCTDSPYFLRDNGVSWDHFIAGIKVTPPVSGNFAWINQGTATIATTSGGVYLLHPAAASNSLKIRKLAAPATPYTIEVGFFFNAMAVDFTQAGVTFRQSSDGKLAALNLQSATGQLRVQVSKYTDATTFSAHYLSSGSDVWPAHGAMIFMQISDNGTNRISRISLDNQNWIDVHTIGRTDFLTADEVGFFAQAGNTAFNMGMHLLHWRQF